MAYRREPFASGEWYHCFTRGVDKRVIFETPADFYRFIELLYLANSTETIDRGRIQHLSHKDIFSVPRGDVLVAIGAYCLMSNHLHLLAQEKIEGGMSKFMHKVLTGYSMYFNIKRKRVGNLFITPFRSKHIGEDRYLRCVTHYIHLNPVETFEAGWKVGRVKNIRIVEKKTREYPYSSAPDYYDSSRARPECTILDSEAIDLFNERRSFKEVLSDALVYYQEFFRINSSERGGIIEATPL